VAPEVLHDPADAAGLEDAWRTLAGEIGASYFCTPDWVLSWWETYGCGQEVELAVWREPEGLAAVAGLVAFDQRLHPQLPTSVRTWANLASRPGSADHYAWPVRPGWEHHVRAWLGAQAARRPMILTNLDPEMGVPLVPHGRCIGRSPCPRTSIVDGGPPAVSGDLRRHIRASERRLAAVGVGFRWIGPGEVDDRVLDALFDLHAGRGELRSTASTFDRTRAPLLRALTQRAGPGRGPVAVLAEQDAKPVGILFGFMWCGVFAFYQSGWDPSFAPLSLGTVLLDKGTTMAGAAGCHTWDFLRGAHEYKYRFGATDRVDETWLVPSGAAGRVLDLRFRAKARLSRQPPG